MATSNKMVKLIQQQLNQYFALHLSEDGYLGPTTQAALLRIPTISTSWTNSRKLVGAIQHFATITGIDAGPIDGYWGPQTSYAYEQLQHYVQHGQLDFWRDEENDPRQQWPVYSEENMTAFFGPVGTNQSKVTLPYSMRLAWALDRTLTRFTCHRLVVDSIQNALEEILEYYTLDGIRELKLDYYGGCLNVRKMRGGRRWSTHAWGTAIDFIPQENRLRWNDTKASLAQPVYNEFWAAWARQGWTSLGKIQNRDWMHVQAPRV